MEYATLDRVAGEKDVNQRKKEGFARLEPFEEGADRSVRGEETGADLAACGECGEALDNTVGSGDRMSPGNLRMYWARLEARGKLRARCERAGETGFVGIGQNP